MADETLADAIFAYIASSDSITEGSTNLYFTNARARAALSLTGSPSYLTYNSTSGVFNSVYNFNQNLLTTSSPVFNGLTVGALSGVLKATAGVIADSATTTDLPEGTNLYYTSARFNTAFSAKSTSDLTEGTNLYYTNTRAQNAISLTGSPSYLTYASGVFNSVYNFNQALTTTSSPTFNSMTLTVPLGVSSGGTGQTTYTNGQLLIGNTTGNTLTKATLTGSSDITITNGAGSITINTIQNIQTTSSPTFANLTLNGSGSLATLTLNNGTANYVSFPQNGSGAPAFTTRSNGTRLVLAPYLSGSTVDYAIGVESNAVWFSVPAATGQSFKWYGATTQFMSLTNTGLTLSSGSLTVSAGNITMTGIAGVGGVLTMNNATTNYILLGTAGISPPAFTTRSVGTRFILYNQLSGSFTDYALGMESSAMWLSVGGTTASFKWYGATTNFMTLSSTALTLPTANLVLTAGNITLPTSGGTAANLNYYEEYTANLSFTGTCFTGAQSVACKIYRIGGKITFMLTSLTVAASGTSASYTTAASSVPTRLVPGYSIRLPISVMNNSLSQLGVLVIQTDGTVIIYFNADTTTVNTNSGNCGHYPAAVSYCL